MNEMSLVKKTLMELVMLDQYDVSDKVGVCEFIERMDDKQIEELANDIILLEDDCGCKTLLESKYNAELQKKNSSVFMAESLFSNHRNNILLQESDSDVPKYDIGAAIKTGGVMGGAMWYMKTVVTNPPEASRQLANLKRHSLDLYHSVARAIHNLSGGHITLPELSRTDKALTDLHDIHFKASEQMKAGKPLTDQMRRAAKRAELRVKKARSVDLSAGMRGVKKAGNIAALSVLALMGTTALALFTVRVYQKYLSDAAKNCRGKSGAAKELCINTFKIHACDAAIQKCKEALIGCSNKNNPEKCMHSIKTQIWNWERRKKTYQQKIISITKHAVTPPRNPSTFEPEDMPSKNSKKRSGAIRVF
jgi:hypothetical protein